jgi:cyanophycin synthetase
MHEDDRKFNLKHEGKFQMHIPLAQVPITHNGALRFQVANVMAAIAAGWALKLNWEGMCEALSHFVSDAQNVPGRFNVFDYKQAKVIVDFGHNADAVKAIVEAIHIFPAHRRSVVICGTGDRRDEDLRALTRNIGHALALVGVVNRVVVHAEGQAQTVVGLVGYTG